MIRLFNRYFSRAATLCVAAEVALLYLSVWIAYQLRLGPDVRALFTPLEFSSRVALFVIVVSLTLYFRGLYDFSDYTSRRQAVIRIWTSIGIATVAVWAVYYVFPGRLFMGRGVFALAAILSGLLLTVERMVLRWILTRRQFADRVLIVGADEDAKMLAREILSRKNLGYHLLGFVTDDLKLQGVSLVNPRVIGTTSQVCMLALANEANRVVVAQRDYRGKLDMDALLACKTSGIRVERGSSYYEKLTGKIALGGLRKSWLVFSDGFVVSSDTLFWKRVLDLVVASIGLMLAIPVMLLVAIAVCCDSRGPVLFKQERVGKGGRNFVLWKFRSMSVDAEEEGEAVWARQRDLRVTRIGRLIRQTRLDEMPQLWNVLRGDMSFVGPRPERPVFVSELIERNSHYRQRLVVRPGLTGWAQIKGAYAASYDESLEKLQFDLYYIKNLSVLLDISIVASTLRTVLLGRGAR